MSHCWEIDQFGSRVIFFPLIMITVNISLNLIVLNIAESLATVSKAQELMLKLSK